MRISPDISQSTLLTLHDAITDSPVYRSTSLHFDEQLDLLEKWLDSLAKYVKLYVEKLNKFNLETHTLCKKVIPSGIDDMMIDPNFTGAVIKSFADALQTSLAFKTKLVTDLEENFIAPLTQFTKTHLKEFKDFRKQHEKVLERYDNQLLKYTSQTKSKEASAVREEAFRLYEARKSYVRMSGQHVVRILHFRSVLEHFLVERFSMASDHHMKDLDGSSGSWASVQSSLVSWKQWLVDDKDTCNYQLHKLQSSRTLLENRFLNYCRPARDLDKYATLTPQTAPSRHSLGYTSSGNMSSHKWGYLFVRGSRNYWTRRWLFLYDGWFGLCNVNPAGRPKGAITLGDRVSVLLCDVKPIVDIDRRFCFEVMCAHQAPFMLQAETEEDMLEWMSAFEKSKILMLQSQQSPKNTVDNEGVGDKQELGQKETSSAGEGLHRKTSIVMLSSSAENKQFSNSTSLTPLLVWEASRASNTSGSSTQSYPSNIIPLDSSPQTETVSSSWGIPWALIPSMFQGAALDDISHEMPVNPVSPNIPAPTDSDGHQVIWPTRIDDSYIPKVDLQGYSADIEYRNRELRHLFGGVAPTEVVLTAFSCSLKKKPLVEVVDTKELEVPLSPMLPNNTVDSLEQEFTSQLVHAVKEPSSSYGYMYTGHAYVTQETFWFYSSIMMTCVNTVAIRLKDIDKIRLIRDPSILNNGTNSNMVMVIELMDHLSNKDTDTLVFTTLMDDIEVIAEKLKFAVYNAKLSEPTPLQITFDAVQSLSAVASKNRNNDVKLVVTPSLTPTQSEIAEPVVVHHTATSAPSLLEPISSPVPSRSADSKKKTKTPRKFPAPLQPKSGALAAAMMAASVAGGSGFLDAGKDIKEESRQLLRNKKSKVNLVDKNESSTSSTMTSNVVVTDIADVESAEDKPYDPPKDFTLPSGPVSCGCDNHLDKLEAEIELAVPAKQLFHILFDDNTPTHTKIWEKKTTENKSRDFAMNAWEVVNGKKERTLTYIIPVSNPMVKIKEADVVEKQVIEKKEEYLSYVVLVSTKTAQLPYSDAFIPYLKYCITWIDEDHCKLSCYIGVKFLKTLLVKAVVNKAAVKGMSESIATFLPVIQHEVAKLNRGNKNIITKDKVDDVTLKRMGSIKRPSVINKPNASNTHFDVVLEGLKTVMELITGLVESLSTSVKMGGVLILLAWIIYGCLPSRSHKAVPDMHVSSAMPSSISSRAVYLRDIDEGLFNAEATPFYGNTDSFRSFVEQKMLNRSLGTNYRWQSSFHHHFSMELLFSRERLGMLRHDALVLFQLVNDLDAQLLESEYINWMMDVRLKCKQTDADQAQLHCEDVQRQLKVLPTKSNSYSS